MVWINVKVNRWTKKRDNVAVDLFFVMAEKHSAASRKSTVCVSAHQYNLFLLNILHLQQVSNIAEEKL
jgi:hypothetical protein